MTRTEELLKLCDGSTTLAALLQEDLRQLIELVRLQNEAIVGIPWRNQTIASKKAIAAFTKFEQGGE